MHIPCWEINIYRRPATKQGRIQDFKLGEADLK